ncbi:MAG TPA: molybdopterin-guanine dinucleotide biosynthesis protein B [Chloroflexi bacterium]|nr:molybdopterin-guanine dinucleotide biosynthesis protein B [Chloroflexota bacterium]
MHTKSSTAPGNGGITTISVVGWHNVGKTAFVERLLEVLKRRGMRVATIKHARSEFDIDREGTDTWRYRHAGSSVVMISAPGRVAMIEERDDDAELEELLARLPAGMDLAIIEGFKRHRGPKIEVTTRQAWTADGRITPEGQLLALVSDDLEADAAEAPLFRRNDVEGVLTLLEELGIISPTAGE